MIAVRKIITIVIQNMLFCRRKFEDESFSFDRAEIRLPICVAIDRICSSASLIWIADTDSLSRVFANKLIILPRQF